MSVTVGIIESGERDLAPLVRSAGLNVVPFDAASGLASIDRSGHVPDVLVVDLRRLDGFPHELADFKRRHGRTGVVIVVSTLDPRIMLDAMRAGVTDVVPEPLPAEDQSAAVERV